MVYDLILPELSSLKNEVYILQVKTAIPANPLRNTQNLLPIVFLALVQTGQHSVLAYELGASRQVIWWTVLLGYRVQTSPNLPQATHWQTRQRSNFLTFTRTTFDKMCSTIYHQHHVLPMIYQLLSTQLQGLTPPYLLKWERATLQDSHLDT